MKSARVGPESHRGGFAPILIVLIVLASVVIGAGAIYFLIVDKTAGPFPLPSNIPLATASPSPSSDNSSSEALAKDETANWNAYTYKQLGLFLKYPNTWQFDSSNPNRLTTTRATDKKASGDYTPGTASILIDAKAGMEPETLQAYSAGVIKTEEITIDGLKAKKYIGTEGVAGSVHFVRVIAQPKDTYTYIFSFSTQDTDLLTDLTNEFNQILSTVKFVPIVN